MAMTPGLNSAVRLGGLGAAEAANDGVTVDVDGEDLEPKGDHITIEHDDGSITIDLGGGFAPKRDKDKIGWFDNLVDDVPEGALNGIADELIRGIDADIESRKAWIEQRATGVKLLGLTIDVPNQGGVADGAPVEGQSRVRHPLLLEAVLRFAANARSELLPTDGPVKIRNDDNNAELKEDQLANALEMDLNHYLTSVATEYYPDTDRMLFKVGFGGSGFKKIYFCPLRNRPVSESVDADDLIVNQAATDLQNGKRVTHRVTMRPSTVRRLQIMGVYKDVPLTTPLPEKLDSLQREEKAQQGVEAVATRPEDRDREIYECYCELDLPGFEHEWKGKPSGLEIPYRVTIDVSSRTILSLVRNYDETTKALPVARRAFVKYPFVPGMGFYDIGLLHILGNTTNAITAAWRELLDAGMYANFPGFLVAKNGARQNTNIFRVPPGGGAQIDTGGLPIGQAVMPLPYQQPSVALMQLVDNMAQTGMRIGGTSEMQVGEGRADAPVGTTLAMIEQATKVLDAVHKRLHAAQAEEFQLLVECFKEHPESFWQRPGPSRHPWDEATFLQAIGNCDLVPQADPNTASHAQRVMKITALKQLQQAQPGLYDPLAIDTAALQAIGWSNPQQFFAPPEAQKQPPPELMKMQQEAKIQQQKADADTMRAQAELMEAKNKVDLGHFAPPPQQQEKEQQPEPVDPLKKIEVETKLMDAQTRAKALGLKHAESNLEDRNRDLDRQSRERVQVLELARDVLLHPEGADAEKGEKKKEPKGDA